MSHWLTARFTAFRNSYDPEEPLAASNPSVALAAAMLTEGVIAAITWVPSLAESARPMHPLVSSIAVVLATAATITAWRHGCRGSTGTSCTWLSLVCWYVAIVQLAVGCRLRYAVGFALTYALMVLLVHARMYGLTLAFAVALAMPVAVLAAWFRPPATAALVLLGAVSLALVVARTTSRRHEQQRRHRKLEQALSVADEVADESMQAALATTLLGLGHFLHETRNRQTAIAANLAYLEKSANLSGDALDAVLEIREAQAAEQRLLTRMLDELRERAKPEIAPFSVRDVVAQGISEFNAKHRIVLSGGDSRYQLVGNPEHLQLIVHNLVRNAVQAGANVVHVEVSVQPNGDFVTIRVHDDGPGISVSRRSTLFKPFANSSRPNGTGLGLYLCRRYVGLFGGTVAVGEGPLGGAAFTIHLPGKAAYRDSVVRELAPRASRSVRLA